MTSNINDEQYTEVLDYVFDSNNTYRLDRMDLHKLCILLDKSSPIEFFYSNFPDDDGASVNQLEKMLYVDGNCNNEELTSHFPKAEIEIALCKTYDSDGINGYIMSVYVDDVLILDDYPFAFDLNNREWVLGYTLGRMCDLHIKMKVESKMQEGKSKLR